MANQTIREDNSKVHVEVDVDTEGEKKSKDKDENREASEGKRRVDG